MVNFLLSFVMMLRVGVYKCDIFIWVFVKDVVFWINISPLTSVTKLQIVLPSGRTQQKPKLVHSVHKSQRKVVWEQSLLGFG